MADLVYNIAKGKVAELVDRVEQNDPTNSAIIVVPVSSTATDAVMKDYDTLSAVLGDANTSEVTDGTWARKTLTDADLSSAVAVDDTNDRMDAALPAYTWTALTGTAATHLVICYDGDTTAGTDANIIPLLFLVAAITPDGSDVTVNAGDIFRAS